MLYAFELNLNGVDLTRRPLGDRRASLPAVVKGSGILLSEALSGTVAQLTDAVRGLGLEGVIAKREKSRYDAGARTDAWLKLKLDQQQEFVIGGYRPGPHGVDALLVGYHEDRTLRFAGKVRAEFTPSVRRDVGAQLKPFHAARCPFVDLPDTTTGRWGGGVTAEQMAEIQWIKPTLVAQIRFIKWTAEGRLRHAAFLGLAARSLHLDLVNKFTYESVFSPVGRCVLTSIRGRLYNRASMATDPSIVNVYCDESSHLPRDGHPFMVLGALWAPADVARTVAEQLRAIKLRHHCPRAFEAKWSKVSPANLPLYLELLEFFLQQESLRFRALIAPKGQLQHGLFDQDHDTWYYKMYYTMLRPVLVRPGFRYRVFIDIKDTRSAAKVRHLHDVLCSSLHDFDRQRVLRVQNVHSSEIEQLQLTDLIVGILNYANRGLTTNGAKLALVSRLRRATGFGLTTSTPVAAQKINVFRWTPTTGPTA